MAPHIDTLIMHHKQRFENPCLSVESYPIPSEDVFVVPHELWAVFLLSDIEVLFFWFNHYGPLISFDLIHLRSLLNCHSFGLQVFFLLYRFDFRWLFKLLWYITGWLLIFKKGLSETENFGNRLPYLGTWLNFIENDLPESKCPLVVILISLSS